jgi:hypothetical protein
MFRVSMTIEGDVVIDRVLQGIEDRARDLTPVWPRVVEIFRRIVAKAFETEGASTGAPWPQLKPRTQADRKRLGLPPAHPILQRTGALLRALTIGEGAFVATTPSSMRYIVSEQEAGHFKYHQSNRPRTRLPRRAPVLLTADDRTALVHPIRLYITGRDPNAPQRARVG